MSDILIILKKNIPFPYELEGITTKEFDLGVKYNSIIKLNPLYSNGSAYIRKIRAKFPKMNYYESKDAFFNSL
jgi:hypothetical protein